MAFDEKFREFIDYEIEKNITAKYDAKDRLDRRSKEKWRKNKENLPTTVGQFGLMGKIRATFILMNGLIRKEKAT